MDFPSSLAIRVKVLPPKRCCLTYFFCVGVACKKRKGEASYNSCVDSVRDEGDRKFTVVIAVKMPPSGSKLYVDLPTEKNAAGEFVFSDYPYWEKSE